jgi:hypothetical protein
MGFRGQVFYEREMSFNVAMDRLEAIFERTIARKRKK